MSDQPRVREIDFSQAHFLDHPLWRCGKGPHQYGGWRTHLRYAWRYRWRSDILAATTCRFGRHRPTRAFKRQGPRSIPLVLCTHCGKRLSDTTPG